jgi:hypothetical protein
VVEVLTLPHLLQQVHPVFHLAHLSWDYGTFTWHTNLDTYDKIVFDDVRTNAILTAILVYQACEDPNKTSREKIVLPINPAYRPTWSMAGIKKGYP